LTAKLMAVPEKEELAEPLENVKLPEYDGLVNP
jgi:hypothetical protein